MRRFRFSFEPVLRLRQRREEQAKIEFAALQRMALQEAARLEQLRTDQQRHEQYRVGIQSQVVDSGTLGDAERYQEALAHAISAQELRTSQAAAAAAAALEALRQRHLERELLQRLRERRLDLHRHEELQREQKVLDDAALLRRKDR
jgi:flagellar export protein FliJ